MIPAAAVADTKNLGCAVGVRMSVNVEGDDEHPASSLRHSEPLRVQNAVGPPIPEVAHLTEETPKISTGISGEEARNILKDDGFRSVSFHKGKE